MREIIELLPDPNKESLETKLERACKHCDEKMLDELLLKPTLSSESIEETISLAFAEACYDGNLKKAQFFFYNEKYKKYIDINYCNTWCFRAAYFTPMEELLTFLIREVKIPRDNKDVVIAMKNENSPKSEFCKRLFDAQELMEDLKENLNERDTKQSKRKI